MSKTIEILRQLRALPMTQAEIARRTGIPQPRVCRWEAGNIPVGADDALKLQALLDGVGVQSAAGELGCEPTAPIISVTRADGTRIQGPDPRVVNLKTVAVDGLDLVERRSPLAAALAAGV